MRRFRDYSHMVLVCGGRHYDNQRHLYRYMDAVCLLHGGSIMVCTGAARGADALAEQWAKDREQLYVGFPALWSVYGRAAGMKRNSEMAALSGAVSVVVFEGGRGTLNMLSIARNMADPRPLIFLPDGEFWK